MEHSEDIACLESSLNYQLQVLSNPSNTVIKPSVDVLNKAEADLLQKVPQRGLGIKIVTEHLLKTVAPALNNASISPNFYGFVTGGVTPAARVAESIVALYDQNVQVHLPDQTIATTVEDRALLLLLDLLRLDGETWSERTLTTGATSSNVLGLACGREYVIDEAIKRRSKGIENEDTNNLKTVTQHGLLAACRAAEVDDVQILTTLPHSSVKKASSICGLGHSSVHDVSQGGEYFLKFDLEKTEELLKRPRMASVVVISCGEVNTGYFATNSFEEFQTLRLLCDKYGAWIHVDAGAFRVIQVVSEKIYLSGLPV